MTIKDFVPEIYGKFDPHDLVGGKSKPILYYKEAIEDNDEDEFANGTIVAVYKISHLVRVDRPSNVKLTRVAKG